MYGPGEILFQEGEYDDNFYYVISGNIEGIYKNPLQIFKIFSVNKYK